MTGIVSKLIEAVNRKPVETLDGLTNEQVASSNKEVKYTSVVHDLVHLSAKEAIRLGEGFRNLILGGPVDDRKLGLEHAIKLLQALPHNSGLGENLADAFITYLYNDLPHPPAMYIGPEYRYRSADGSGNNPHIPELGKSGTSYSRSVPPVQPKAAAPPDPELVYEKLLRRRGFTPHPSGLNRIFFSFATIVIHELFQTNHEKPWINNTTSYFDLSTLYGNNADEQAQVRTFDNGRIWPDVISSERLMRMPPPVIAVLLLFSRHHNYIAEHLLDINECGKYVRDTSKLDEATKKWQDEDIFQLSRNINVAFIAQCVLRDYVTGILNTLRANNDDWHLEIGKEIKELGKRVERGRGNSVSCEFLVLYQWHSVLSAADAQWMEDSLKTSSPEKTIEDVGLKELRTLAEEHTEALNRKEPRHWTFGGLQRGPDGHFDDFQLAELIKDGIEESAHAFGAYSTPAAFKSIEKLSQLRARNVFQVCTMNEFRKHLDLKPFETFLDWNSNPEVAKAAEELYVHIDNLELYPGLLAEESKPAVPGSGLCPGHTIGRGILDDAVSLIRSDRFLTHDLSVYTLTSWGMNQLKPQPGAYGGMLSTVLFRALPGAWPFNSTYGLFPFYTPPAIREIMHAKKKEELYNFERPASDMAVRGIKSLEACKNMFLNREDFQVLYGHNILEVTNNTGSMTVSDDAQRDDPLQNLIYEPFFSGDFEEGVKDYFVSHTHARIEKCAMPYGSGKSSQIDIVRDITNVVPIVWLAQKYGIPLKTPETPHGLVSPTELLMMLLPLFIYTSFPLAEKTNWQLREAATQGTPMLQRLLEARLRVQGGLKPLAGWLAKGTKGTAYEISPDAERMYTRLLACKRPMAELVTAMIGTMIPVAGNLTQQTALLVDLYLQPKYEEYKKRIIELANRDDKEAFEELEGFVYEGMRIQPVVIGLPRQATRDLIIKDGDRDVHIKAGQRLVIGTSQAHLDPKAFPDPEKLNPHRPLKDYILFGKGLDFCFGDRPLGFAMAAMLKEIFKLPNLRRTPGRQGSFVQVSESVADGIMSHLFLDSHSRELPLPTSLVLEFDTDSAC